MSLGPGEGTTFGPGSGSPGGASGGGISCGAGGRITSGSGMGTGSLGLGVGIFSSFLTEMRRTRVCSRVAPVQHQRRRISGSTRKGVRICPACALWASRDGSTPLQAVFSRPSQQTTKTTTASSASHSAVRRPHLK